VSNSRFQKPTHQFKTKKPLPRTAHPLKRLIDYGHNYRLRIWQAIACSILNKIFDLAPPALIGAAVDVVVKKEDSLIAQLGVRDVFGQLLVLTFLSFIIWGLESIFEYAYAWLWRNLAQSIQHDLRIDTYSHLQELELAYFEERSTGGLMSILSDDINQLERFLNDGANEVSASSDNSGSDWRGFLYPCS
jgi:ATP-binding cassette subfamily B protein